MRARIAESCRCIGSLACSGPIEFISGIAPRVELCCCVFNGLLTSAPSLQAQGSILFVLLRCLRQLPFTLFMFVLLVALGVHAQTHVGPLRPDIQAWAGHSPRLLWNGELYRLATSLLYTAGGWRFYCSIAMFCLAVGCVEWIYGTATSLSAFFGIHLATLLLMSIGVSLSASLLETHRSNLLWYAQDVGPSAGYYGCLGLAIGSLTPSRRVPLVIGIGTLLLLRLGWSACHIPENGRMLSADISHAIAFPLGLITSRLVPARWQRKVLSDGLE